MPVPKTLANKTEAASNLTETTTELEGELPAGVTEFDRFDYERRREALSLAINARELDPLPAAREYHAFLAGDKQPEETA